MHGRVNYEQCEGFLVFLLLLVFFASVFPGRVIVPLFFHAVLSTLRLAAAVIVLVAVDVIIALVVPLAAAVFLFLTPVSSQARF